MQTVPPLEPNRTAQLYTTPPAPATYLRATLVVAQHHPLRVDFSTSTASFRSELPDSCLPMINSLPLARVQRVKSLHRHRFDSLPRVIAVPAGHPTWGQEYINR